ncbi:unnamed protein product [Caretta caretta]
MEMEGWDSDLWENDLVDRCSTDLQGYAFGPHAGARHRVPFFSDAAQNNSRLQGSKSPPPRRDEDSVAMMFKTVQQMLEAQRRNIRELRACVNELMMEGQSPAPLNRLVASVNLFPSLQWTASPPPELAASEEIEGEPVDYLSA